MTTIKRFAVEKRKTIIMTVHQPSSQMFYMFDQLLLLANGGAGGRLAYFGPINGVVPFFGTLGHNIGLHYNPADYILEVVATAKVKNGGEGEGGIEEIIEAAAAEAARRQSGDEPHHAHHHHHHHHHHWKKTASLKSIELSEMSEVKFSDCNQSAVSMGDHHHHHHAGDHHSHHHHHHHLDSDSGRSSWSEPDRSSEVSLEQPSSAASPQPNLSPNKETGHVSLSMGVQHQQEEALFKNLKDKKKLHPKKKLSRRQPPKWPTSMWTQVRVLTERNFTEAKSRMLSKLNWIQTVVLAILAGLIWYRPTRTEETMEDIRGWMFFSKCFG